MIKKIIAFTILTSLSVTSLWASEKDQDYKVIAGNDLVSLGTFSDWEAFFFYAKIMKYYVG